MSESFIDWCISFGISKESAKKYNYQIGKFFRDNGFNGVIDVQKLTDQELLEMMERFAYSNRRVYIRRFALSNFLKFIDRKYLIDEFLKNTKKLNTLPPRKILKKSLDMDDFRRLIKELPDILSLVLRIMFETGLRISPVLGLTRDNIGVEDGRIKLVVKEKGGAIITTYLTKDTSKVLADYYNQYPNSNKVFNISYQTFEKHLKKYSKGILGFPITTHWMKHQKSDYMTNVLGKNIYEVQRGLHHKRVSTTLTYFDQSGADSKKHVQDLEDDMKW